MNIIFLNKKPGITSFDALRDIKKELKTGKVGHTGTLDKFAQGLLIVLTGKALKLAKYFIHCDKQYIGKIRFGEETETLDPEGQVIAQASVPSREQAEGVLPQFTGYIMQTPPAYSALHIDGKRASELVRAGIVPEMKARPVTIYKLEIKSWDPPFCEIFVHCSGGTYIRALARDIALAAGSRGYLAELVRTRIAGFELEAGSEELKVRRIDKTVIEKLGLSWFDITPADAEYIRHGRPLNHLSVLCTQTEDLPVLSMRNKNIALFCNDELTAIIEKKDGKWKYGTLFTLTS